MENSWSGYKLLIHTLHDGPNLYTLFLGPGTDAQPNQPFVSPTEQAQEAGDRPSQQSNPLTGDDTELAETNAMVETAV